VVEVIPEATRTEAKWSGKFNVFETPNGGYHLVYVLRGETEARHFAVPAYLVKMADAAIEGRKVNLGALIHRKKP
jgi:hypothetical protein